MSHLSVFNTLTYIYRLQPKIRLFLVIVNSLGLLMPCRADRYKVTYNDKPLLTYRIMPELPPAQTERAQKHCGEVGVHVRKLMLRSTDFRGKKETFVIGVMNTTKLCYFVLPRQRIVQR
jgi:hypothetical protein